MRFHTAENGPMLLTSDVMTEPNATTVESLLDELRSAYAASEARFRALIEHSADITAIVDSDGVVTYISASIERILGFTPAEIVGGVGSQFVSRDDIEVDENSAGTVSRFRARHKDGSWRHLEANGIDLRDDPAVKGMVYTVRDITAQRELERRLRQSERLEAIGQLAGGISHDFNNVLLVIRGYTSILRSSLDDPSLIADVDEIATAAERAAELTRQLLAFSRRQVMTPALLDVRDVVSGMESL